jgi:hypothetical protein
MASSSSSSLLPPNCIYCGATGNEPHTAPECMPDLPVIDVSDRRQRDFVKLWLQQWRTEHIGEEEPAGVGDHLDDWRAIDDAIAAI